MKHQQLMQQLMYVVQAKIIGTAMFMKQIQSEMGVHSLVATFRHLPHDPPPLFVFLSFFFYQQLFLLLDCHISPLQSSSIYYKAHSLFFFATEYTELHECKKIKSYLKRIQVISHMYACMYDCALLGICWQFQ